MRRREVGLLMTLSNEHPDMSGNPADEPHYCFRCEKAVSFEDVCGSQHHPDLDFCSQQCVDDYEELCNDGAPDYDGDDPPQSLPGDWTNAWDQSDG